MSRTAFIALLLLAAHAAPAHGRELDLENFQGRRLPWRCLVDARSPGTEGGWDVWSTSQIVATDGGDTVVYSARDPGIVANVVRARHSTAAWQHNMPPEYTGRTPCASLAGLWDVDGDGRQDLVAVSRTRDGRRWLIRALDAGTGSIVAERTLEGGADLYSDGMWDGGYWVAGVTDVPGPDGPRRAFLVVASAGLDHAPRGLLAFDTVTGDTLWSDLTGAKPMPDLVVCTDLDGDGLPEIAYLAVKVDNLGGTPINGLADDVCRLVVVGSDGTRRWLRPYPTGVSGALRAAPRPDGGADLVVAVSGKLPGESLLEVVAGRDGTPRASMPLEGTALGLAVWPTGDGLDIYFGQTGFGIARAHYDGDLAIRTIGRRQTSAVVRSAVELLPSPGPEVLISYRPGSVAVLGADLDPLAFHDEPGAVGNIMDIEPAVAASGRPAVLVRGAFGMDTVQLEFAPAPRRIPWEALALVPALAGGAWMYRRGRRRTSAATRRELRLQLLGRLELSNHGAIGALRSLRRLVWLLDARAQAGGASPELDRRLADLAVECREHMLPELAATLELAQLAGCADGILGQGRTAADRIDRRLRSEAPDDDDLRKAAASLDQALQDLRAEVEGEFRSDLAAAVARVLKAHAPALAEHGVAVHVAGLDTPLWVRLDPEELVFVLDNLVENAVRAMTGGSVRELHLAAVRDGGGVVLTVRDTGCGIPPEEWESVLETRSSTRAGGGLGLPASRALLRKHGGSLAILASEAGKGTTFAMNAVPARAQESV